MTLPPRTVAALFGEGYQWRGSERVRVVGAGRGEVTVPALPGSQLLVELDRLDRGAVGGTGGLVVGPRGSVDAASIGPMRRLLILPGSLSRPWGLVLDQTVALEVGTLIVTDVVVAEGEPAGAHLDRADVVAADLPPETGARLRRDIATAEAEAAPSEGLSPGRLITENDVRQARLKGRRVAVHPGQKITPAAASLGKELGILDLQR